MADELDRPVHENEQVIEDDPLAELARIVAGEDEPEQASSVAPVAMETPVEPPVEDDVPPVTESAAADEVAQTAEAVQDIAEQSHVEESVLVDEEIPAETISADPELSELDSADSAMEELEAALESGLGDVSADASGLQDSLNAALEPEPQDDFMDGLKSALDEAMALEPAPVPVEAAPVEPQITEVPQADVSDAAAAAMEQVIEEGASVREELALGAEAEIDLNPEIEETSVHLSDDLIAQTPHSEEQDLGDVFANEFQQVLEQEQIVPEPAPAPVDPVSHDNTLAAGVVAAAASVTAGAAVTESSEAAVTEPSEIDFGSAFAEELGIDTLGEADGWSSGDTEAAEADFAQAVLPGDVASASYAEPDAFDPDPGHMDNVVPGGDVAAGAAIANANDNTSQGGRKYAVAALVIALFAGTIAAGYGFLGGDALSTANNDDPVLVKAEIEPFKEKPEDPGGRVPANQDKASYEQVEGQTGNGVVQESLVSENEEPATVDEEQLVEISEPESNLAEKSVERLSSTEAESNTATVNDTLTTQSDLTPKVVQTVTVKPDGTIVNKPLAQEPLAQASRVIETATNTASDAVNSVQSLREIATEVKPVETTVIKKPAAIDGAQSTGTIAIPEASPLPKPVVQPQAEPVKVAVAAPEPTPQPVQPQAARKSEWVVQVSSQRSADAAQASFLNLRNRFSAMQGRPMSIQRANVNGSTFYRVRLQTASRDDANQLCTSLKAQGGSCFVTR